MRYELLDHDGAFNFARLNNTAIARFGHERDLFLFLNNDVELSTPQTLQVMAMQLLADRGIGFVGIKLYYPGGNEIQHGGVRFVEHVHGSGYHLAGAREINYRVRRCGSRQPVRDLRLRHDTP